MRQANKNWREQPQAEQTARGPGNIINRLAILILSVGERKILTGNELVYKRKPAASVTNSFITNRMEENAIRKKTMNKEQHVT